MYAGAPNSYEKFFGGPPPPPPGAMFTPDSSTTTTGIPVSSTSQFYSSDNSRLESELETKRRDPWSTGLCDCFSDGRNCCLTYWCPCITFGRIAEIVDEGKTSCAAAGAIYGILALFTGCGCLYSCLYRPKIRHQYMLKETPCNDCLVHCCCESCALCQEYNELKNHGFDMSIGWHGNMEKRRNGGMPMTAPTAQVFQGTMNR